jgi:hypothetical protein
MALDLKYVARGMQAPRLKLTISKPKGFRRAHSADYSLIGYSPAYVRQN